MKKARKVFLLLAMVALVAAYFNTSESTRRYLKHVGRQVPSLPYRYFI